MPGGVSHDPWASNDAPRIMQAASDGDFQAEVKLESVLSQRYQSQGIIVEQDSDDWMRFDIHSNGTTINVLAASIIGGSPGVELMQSISSGASQTPMWLRVTRTIDQWTVEHSTDGQNWTVDGTFSHSLTVTAIGVFGGNFDSSGSAPAHTAIFDYFFDTSAPIVPEDTP